MKYGCSQIAPVEAVPCSNEARGSEAYKRKMGGNSVFCTKPALQKMTLFLITKQAAVVWEAGMQYRMAASILLNDQSFQAFSFGNRYIP